jgi:hypothetical protein
VRKLSDLDNAMTLQDEHIANLRTAEMQFSLASAVRLATSQKTQPLDVPIQWSHGKHLVHYSEIALSQEDADYAACFLQRSCTFLMAVAIKDAIKAAVINPKQCSDVRIRTAYQIARMIRNAFTHAPFYPVWSIDSDCRDQAFEIENIIALDTRGLNSQPFDWRHYGGPLAILRLSQFVRTTILHDPQAHCSNPGDPKEIYSQQGSLILKKVDQLPADAVPL